MSRYRLAELLHKTVAEIEQISEDEFIGWIGYFKVKGDK